MNDMEEFLSDLDRVTDALKDFERSVGKDNILNDAIDYYEAKEYFIKTWCPKRENEEKE